jgi:serine/threonine protein kinase/Flp pilus assembly protein TadD
MNNPSPLEAIFFAALEKGSPQERAAHLDQACAGDPDLRRCVERLLAAEARAGSFLEQPARSLLVTGDEQPLREGPGAVIGPYKLLEQIGEGGFGVVFLAEQTQPVRRKVALKVLKAGMDTRQVIARFEAERQALAIMDHPNIARVLDGGEAPSGRPYFVMELVKGVPITDFCDQNHLTPRQRLELFLPVCQAVQHAHQKGIIHRDLKPSNILVSVHDTTPVVKVIDFGVAKALGQSLTDKTLFTGFAQMIGTPLYMSPEQAGQSGLDIDTRSDIYSLGVLLYELLTGTTPFTRERFKQAAYDEMRRIIREEDPPRPSTRLSESKDTLLSIAARRQTEPAKLRRLVRGELDWIVMKALEKDRNRRYQTANGLALDVQRYLSDEPVLACPPSAGYRLRKFARRNKGRLAVAAGVFLAVTVMAASIGWAVRDRAARAAEVELAETARRAKVEGQVRDSLNTARALLAENELPSAREKLAQARTQLGNDASVLEDLAAEIAAAAADLDRLHQFLGRIERAHEAEMAPLLEASAAAGSLGRLGAQPPPRTGGDRWPTAAVPFLLAALRRYGVLERDDWDSTLEGGFLGKHQAERIRRLAYEELLWLADDIARRRQGHRSEGKLSPQAAARAALVYLGKAERAHRPTPALFALRALCRKALGEEAAAKADAQQAARTPPTMAVDHYLRGQGALDANQLDVGVQAFESALRLEPTHYRSMMKLGYCLGDLGRGPEDFVGAVRVFTGCILKRPDHAHAYYCRANAYFLLRRYQEAVADSTRAIDLDPKFAPAWYNRGVIHNKLGQPARAVTDFTRAIHLEPKFSLAWYNRARTYTKLGRPARAVADFTRAIHLEPKFAPAWNNRGRAYSELGRLDKAVADLTRAIELEPNDALAWHNRGAAYVKLGQPARAVADSTRAIDLDPKYAAAWNNRGWAYNLLGQSDKAIADCSRAIDLDPNDALARYNRGVIYDQLNQPAKAFTDFSRAIDLDPKFALAWYCRGVVLNKLGQPARAVVDYTRAIKLDPRHAPTWNNRGLAYSSWARRARPSPTSPRPSRWTRSTCPPGAAGAGFTTNWASWTRRSSTSPGPSTWTRTTPSWSRCICCGPRTTAGLATSSRLGRITGRP